jgi:outer membrane protein assembly factor BamA
VGPIHDRTIIGEIHFYGDAGLAISEQNRLEDIYKVECDCNNAVKELTERVRNLYQEHGYYKVEARGASHLLSVEDGHRRVSVDVTIEQNLQYRLKSLELAGQKAFSAEQLRTLFPIRPGEVFDVGKIREGLDNLRKLYGEHGYINLTPVPDTKPDDAQAVVDLSIDIDEGAQFRVGSIAFSGAGARDRSFQERVLKSLKFKLGDVYDSRLLEAFFNENHSWLPPGSTVEDHVEIAQNAREHTVDLYFVFK